jgi:hypothetical protein
MSYLRDGRTRVAALLATLLTVPTLLGCHGETAGVVLGGEEAVIVCGVSQSSVAAGSTSPVIVTVEVTRDGIGSVGERVQFETDIGDVSPDAVTTDGNGRASSNFFPPLTPGGTATIRAQIVDAGNELVATCQIQITPGTSDPLLSVSVVTPAQLAGVDVAVGYDPAFVDLPEDGIELLGDFASPDCQFIADDDEDGSLQVVVLCSTLRTAGGTDIMRLAFENVGGTVVGIDNFTVSCSGVDESGTFLPTLCDGRVTQL